MARQGYWRATGLAILIASVGVIIVWILARVIDGQMRVDGTEENQRLTAFQAAGVAVIFGLIGGTIGWLMIRTRRPVTWWIVLSVLALLLLGVNAFIRTDETSTGIWLNVMHLVAAGAIVPTVAGFFRPSPPVR